MIECPGKCSIGRHPATMTFCPITKMPLKGGAIGDRAEGPIIKQPSHPQVSDPFWKKRKFYWGGGGVLILLVFLTLWYLFKSPSGAPVPKPESVVAQSKSVDRSSMVPIRTLDSQDGMVWIDMYEVSVMEFRDVMGKVPQQPQGFGDNQPVVNVSYVDAETYAQKAGKRLCTESEWKAAAGVYPGDKEPDFHKAVTSASPFTSKLSKPQDRSSSLDRSEINACNLLGNVREWIASAVSKVPQYIGACWQDTTINESAMLQPVQRPGGAPDATIGFRCCLREVGAPKNQASDSKFTSIASADSKSGQ